MTSDEFDLAACPERVRTRDESAAKALVEHLYPLVAKLVQAHLPRNDDPRDLVREVFLKVFTRLEQFRGSVPFEHWISRVAVATSIDALRAQKRRPACRWSELTNEEQSALNNMSTDTTLSSERDTLAWQILEKLLASLAPAERLVIQLMDLEQKTIAEVSAVTGWSSGVVRIRAFRARQKLKGLYRQLGDAPV